MKKANKIAVCASVNQNTIDNINKFPEGKFFSTKLEMIVEAYYRRKHVLVSYKTQEQIDLGEPELINRNAVRVWGSNAHLKGFDFDNPFKDLLKLIAKEYKAKDKIFNVLQSNQAFIVQLVEEPEEIWVSNRMDDCNNCSRLKKIMELCK
jgi:hypothetical protein